MVMVKMRKLVDMGFVLYIGQYGFLEKVLERLIFFDCFGFVSIPFAGIVLF
jgi:hypothetical protein